MESNIAITFSDRVVAFIDILGFSNIVSGLRENPGLHARLHDALLHIKGHESLSKHHGVLQEGLEVSVFSDSIVISSIPERLFDTIWTVGWLQARLLRSGVATRGGISCGPVYHADGILYGEGMLEACLIEKSAAVFPRVVLARSLSERLRPQQKHFLALDIDGLWFIDVFRFDAVEDGADDLAADGNDPREIYLREVGRHIQERISSAKQLDHRSKWSCLAQRYNLAVDRSYASVIHPIVVE